MKTQYEIEKRVMVAAYLAVGLGIINILVLMFFSILMLKGYVIS